MATEERTLDVEEVRRQVLAMLGGPPWETHRAVDGSGEVVAFEGAPKHVKKGNFWMQGEGSARWSTVGELPRAFTIKQASALCFSVEVAPDGN